MSLLNDTKHDTLRTQLGAEGHVNDLEHAWLVALGATAGRTLVDMWSEVFDAAAIPAGQFNDRAVAYIVQVTVPPGNLGSYNNHWLYYWQNATLGPPAPQPPALANLLHWFDFSDASTVWQDNLGTIPAVNGGLVGRIDNKGTDGTPITNANPATSGTYRTGILNGKNIFDGSIPGSRLLDGNPLSGMDPSTTGVTMAMIARLNNIPFAGNSPWQWGGSHRLDSGAGQNFASLVIGPGTESLAEPPALGQWYLVYVSYEVGATTDDKKYVSPGPERPSSPTDPVLTIPGGSQLRIGIFSGEIDIAQTFWWDRNLTAAERTALEAFAEAEYGALPTAPPPVAPCIFPANYYDAVLASRPVRVWPMDDAGPAAPGSMRELMSGVAGTHVVGGATPIGFQNTGPFGISDCACGQTPGGGNSYQAAADGFLDSQLGANREFTFECWVRIQNTALNTHIFGKPDNAGGDISLFIPGSPVNRYRWRLDDNGANALSLNSSSPGNDGVWRHVVGMRTLTTGVHGVNESRLYINGVLDQQAAYSNTAIVGSWPDIVRMSDRNGLGTQGALNGDIAWAAIYLRALSDAEVLNHYTVGTTNP